MKDRFEFVRDHKNKILALCIWIAIFIIVRIAMHQNNLTLTEVADRLVEIMRGTWYGPFLFIFIYIIRPLLLLPGIGTLLNFVAGMVYGVWVGFPLAVLANLIADSIVYAVSRWFIDKEIEFEGRKQKFVEFMRHNPFEAVFAMQLSYVSAVITSSLAGLLYLPFRPFIIGTLLGGAVSNGIGVFIGSTIDGSIANGNLKIEPEMILISVVMFLTTISISFYLRKRNDSSDE